MKKILAIGGEVVSKDGQVHYVSGSELCRLYNVDPGQCKIISGWKDMLGIRGEYIVLRPRVDGDYTFDPNNSRFIETFPLEEL